MIPDRKPNEYAETAYNSELLPYLTEEDIPETGKQFLGKSLPFGHTKIETIPHYIFDTESPSSVNADEARSDEEVQKEMDRSKIKIDMKWDHRCIRYDTINSWSSFIVMLYFFTLYTTPVVFILFFISAVLLDCWYEGECAFIDPMLLTLELTSVPFAVLAVSWIITKLPPHWWIRNSKGAQWELNRETGMVSIFDYKSKEYKETKKPTVFCRPFYEFEAIIYQVPNRHGGHQETLALRHRKTGNSMDFSCFSLELREKEWIQFWHYIQNYMDISKPLPDTPNFEVCRDYDPTTFAYDEKINRNPRFWRNMSEESYENHRKMSLYQEDINPNAYPCIIMERVRQSKAIA